MKPLNIYFKRLYNIHNFDNNKFHASNVKKMSRKQALQVENV